MKIQKSEIKNHSQKDSKNNGQKNSKNNGQKISKKCYIESQSMSH